MNVDRKIANFTSSERNADASIRGSMKMAGDVKADKKKSRTDAKQKNIIILNVLGLIAHYPNLSTTALGA